ncbi:MAG TPA: heat-inducible transcriptional repressor HrcA [Candidatus Polarisedimenticolaceae bacterium]|nr:heat-inducible transcriptional repressor HrcA [Candidatus Polarisedimenticolaceae bacterium]
MNPDPARNRDRVRPGGLGAREREVLKSVIRAHIVTGTPVGSKTLSLGTGMDLSPATIRNVMAELEERGLLVQPHPSAGRVPTDTAYRLYVDHWMGAPRVVPAQAQAIDEALRTRRDVAELLEEASRQLSRLSHHVGVVLAPELRRIVVEHLEFVRLDPRRVVAVLVDRTGVVHNRIVEDENASDQEDLDRVGRWLTDQFAGRTLQQMREELLRRVSEEWAAGLALARKAVEPAAGEPEGELFVEGMANLLDEPAFADLARMRAILKTLEEKSRLVDLLGRVLDGEGVQVVIGSENPLPGLADCSLVTSTYGAGDRVLGTVGVVGPTRMEYARTVALVDHLAKVLTRLLSSPGARGPA